MAGIAVAGSRYGDPDTGAGSASRFVLRALQLLCVIPASTALASPPDVTIQVPPCLGTWDTSGVKLVVRNTTGQPIVPLAIELESRAGTLSAWGIDGACQGARRECSIALRWAHDAQARRHGADWELLLGATV